MRLSAGIVAAALAFGALSIAPARAQRAGESWGSLIPHLKAQLAAKPDPEVALRLAVVYAHEGLIIEWWHTLKQIDTMTGGEGHRREVSLQVIRAASEDIKRDPSNLLARYELAYASWFVEPDHHTAFVELLEITRQEPRNAMNHACLAYLYEDRKDTKNSIAQWEDAVRLDPSNNAIRYALGIAYSRVGRTANAAVQFALAYRDRTVYDYVTRGELP